MSGDTVLVLPSPGFDMDDLAASDWLLDLSELYGGTDRLNVRRLAQGLAARSRCGAEQAAADHITAIVQARAEVEDLEDELSSLPRDLDRARDKLAELESKP